MLFLKRHIQFTYKKSDITHILFCSYTEKILELHFCFQNYHNSYFNYTKLVYSNEE